MVKADDKLKRIVSIKLRVETHQRGARAIECRPFLNLHPLLEQQRLLLG